MQQPVILFDGVCNFCNTTVNFIIDKDKRKKFKFAALQSNAGQRILKKFNLKVTDFDTLILTEGEKNFQKSTAILKIATGLGGFWTVFYVFNIIPAFIRDFFYDIIAKHRYRWFGKRDECRIPTPEMKDRFLV